jgi:hypothetical protein
MAQITLPKIGSKWSGLERDVFYVMHTIEIEGHTWVHYKKENSGQEYSCYVESFLQRFRELPE